MKTFHKEVDTTDRKAMVDFLKSHFRYYTMNSWNRSTAYANNVKIYNLGIEDKEVEDKIYSLAYMSEDTADVFFDVHELIRGFVRDTGYDAGFNGRSNGYLVMYEMDNTYILVEASTKTPISMTKMNGAWKLSRKESFSYRNLTSFVTIFSPQPSSSVKHTKSQPSP